MAWTVVTDIGSSDESEWTVVLDADTLNDQARGWTVKPMVLSPNAAAKNSFLGWAFTPEEFSVVPELVTTKPEETQADSDGWTIVAEPV